MDILGVGLKEKSVQPPSGSSDRRWGGRSGQEEGEEEVVVAVMLERTLRWAGTRIESSNVACSTRAPHLSKSYRVADPHHFNVDPDSNADPDLPPHQSVGNLPVFRIRIHRIHVFLAPRIRIRIH